MQDVQSIKSKLFYQQQQILLKEWKVRRNLPSYTIPNKLHATHTIYKIKFVNLFLKTYNDGAKTISLSKLFQTSILRLAKLNARLLTRLVCFISLSG